MQHSVSGAEQFNCLEDIIKKGPEANPIEGAKSVPLVATRP